MSLTILFMLFLIIFLSFFIPFIKSQHSSDCHIINSFNTSLPHLSGVYVTQVSPLALLRAPDCLFVFMRTSTVIPVGISGNYMVLNYSDGKLLWSNIYSTQYSLTDISRKEKRIYIFSTDSKANNTICDTLHCLSLITGIEHWNNTICHNNPDNFEVLIAFFLLEGHNADGSDSVVRITQLSQSNNVTTIIRIYNSHGAQISNLTVDDAYSYAQVVGNGREGNFFLWSDISGNHMVMFHVTPQGKISRLWSDNKYDLPMISSPAPLMGNLILNRTNWVGLSQHDESPLWTYSRTGLEFLSPAWPTAEESKSPYNAPKYMFVTPPSFLSQSQPNTLILGSRLMNNTFTYEQFAIYNPLTGDQLARSDLFFNKEGEKRLQHLPFNLAQLSLERSRVEAQPSCYNAFMTTDYIISELHDYPFNSIIFQIDNNVYVLDERTLETTAILALPKPALECTTVLPIGANGDYLFIPSDGVAGWIRGQPITNEKIKQEKVINQ